MSNIVEVVAADRNLVSVGNGMKAGGLEDVLSLTGPFTVFAPTDVAFGKLATGQWLELLQPKNKVRLAGMMNNYVVKGKTNFDDFKDGQKLTTLGGQEMTVKITDGDVDINGARIQERDMEASNGVVHSIDRVPRMT